MSEYKSELNQSSLDYVKEYIDEKNITINDEDIKKYCNLASFYNRLYSESDVGDFLNEGAFEASFISREYIDDDLDFLIHLFASHSSGHSFHNANKRTATSLFKYFLSNFTPYKISKESSLINLQLEFVSNSIDMDFFKAKVKEGLEIKMIAPNEKVKLERILTRGIVTETSQASGNLKPRIELRDLKSDDLFFRQLRKPYFQRDTNSWNVDRVEKMLNSFTEDMLIPSVILWNSKRDGIFVVDGAHRLSALAAWVNDDYGKKIDYLKHLQIKAYIDKTIGEFKELETSHSEDKKEIQNILATKSINIEWITGDYDMVKNSFIRINEQGAVISQDEKEIIKYDTTSIAKLSRAVLSYSGGQNVNAENLSIKNISTNLFLPKYDKSSKTVPMCGDLYDEFLISRIFNLLKQIDGDENLEYDDLILKVSTVVNLIVNELQLNNRVYFYGITYQFKQSALVGITKFIMNLFESGHIDLFTKYREKFESYLIEHPDHIQIIVRKGRQVKNATDNIVKYYRSILEYIQSEDEVALYRQFPYLKNVTKTVANKEDEEYSKSGRVKTMESNYKSEIMALKKCKTCGGYLNNFSNTDIHSICSITN